MGRGTATLCKVGGVSIWSDPDKFTPFEGLVVPDQLAIIQCQFGTAHINTAPRNFRKSHNPLEIPGIAKEGLTGFLYWGMSLLNECRMDFPGSRSGSGDVPYLNLNDEGPELNARCGGGVGPCFGSVSRGSIALSFLGLYPSAKHFADFLEHIFKFKVFGGRQILNDSSSPKSKSLKRQFEIKQFARTTTPKTNSCSTHH